MLALFTAHVVDASRHTFDEFDVMYKCSNVVAGNAAS